MFNEEDETRFPEYIMRDLRERRGLEEDDTSEDNTINLYSKDKAYSEVMAWQGFKSWEWKMKKWIEDIYEVELKDKI